MRRFMNKKVYFAGSIRGGRNDAEFYRKMIAFIKETDTVLTEHIGDLSLSSLEHGEDHDVQIYLQDTAWLKECDLVIAECTCPSLGVGYEMAYAEKLGKPIYIFYNRARTNLSAMLSGDPYFTIIPYDNEEEVFEKITSILEQ